MVLSVILLQVDSVASAPIYCVILDWFDLPAECYFPAGPSVILFLLMPGSFHVEVQFKKIKINGVMRRT